MYGNCNKPVLLFLSLKKGFMDFRNKIHSKLHFIRYFKHKHNFETF